jgi:regulator of nonsense transcripts 2
MRKRHEEGDVSSESAIPGVMNFTMLTKRGNKQQVRQLAIPSESALAVQTRSAQEQDKVEQQHLKRLVLDYEQREEAEEIKGGSNMLTFRVTQTGILVQPLKQKAGLSRFV